MAIWKSCARLLLAAATLVPTIGLAQTGSVPCTETIGCSYFTGSQPQTDDTRGYVLGQPPEQRASFEAVLAPGSIIADGLNYPLGPLSSPLTLQGIGVMAGSGSAGQFTDRDCDGANCTGRFNTTGATATSAASGTWWETSESFTINFVSPFSAFGFYATDCCDFEGTLNVVLTDESGGTSSRTVDFGDTGSLGFFGIVDQRRRFTSVLFSISQTGTSLDYIGFDDFVVGQVESTTPPDPSPIPVPGTALLASLGLGLITVARRRLR